ncbi:hypothetical protein [Chromobacterium phragmitis]|uniref:hypothetical protein n=1 Tax=Chromobacterium phragmitis TaxID=2202141 RepID=UPI0011AEA2D3|nr:hypothetical protein [Chromobacterium phragmitis]
MEKPRKWMSAAHGWHAHPLARPGVERVASAMLGAAMAGAAGDIAQLGESDQKMLHRGFPCRFIVLPAWRQAWN